LKKFAKTTVALIFDSHDDALVSGIQSGRVEVGAGLLCYLIEFENPPERAMLIPVKCSTRWCSAKVDEYEEVNEMEFLAEVHAGNVPDEALKEST